MVEILKQGVPKWNRVHNVTCSRCESELRFREFEAKITHDQRDGDFMSITCPVCKAIVTKGWKP